MSSIDIEDRSSFRARLASGYAYVINPNTPIHRYIALALICLLGFGNYYCYDAPESLETQIEEYMAIGKSEYTTLFALYSWPNVIMSFFGGLLIDNILGIRLGAIVFLSILVVGQLLVSMGAFMNTFLLMQLGRFIYGLGGESLSVAQNAYVVSWFKGFELNMVFGFQISVSRGGSFLALNTMYPMYTYFASRYIPTTALGYAMFIAALTCVGSLFFSILLALYDRRAERILGRQPVQSDESFSLKQVIDFKTEFWIINIICATFYVTIFPFIALASTFFLKKWGVDQSWANLYASAVYVIAAVGSPFIGTLVDKLGCNIVFLIVAGLFVVLSHLTMALTYIPIPMAVLLLGTGYSIMCCALWPLVALVVPQHSIGTAYGVTQSVQNAGLTCVFSVTGYIVDQGYIVLELFFVLLASISVIFSVILLFIDKSNGGALNRSAKDRAILDQEDEQ